MHHAYTIWNKRLGYLLRLLVILGVLAAIPLAYTRHQTEQTGKQVEFVFDYRDLLDIASLRPDPEDFIRLHLDKMKEAGITSLSVYESSLQELEESRRLKSYTAGEAAALTGFDVSPNESATYVVFTDADQANVLDKLIRDSFAQAGYRIDSWSFKGKPGLKIQAAREEALLYPLDPDPITMQMLKDQGFHLVVRLSDQRQPFDAAHMDAQLQTLQQFGVTRIIFDGQTVTGFTNNAVPAMAKLMNKHGIGAAAVEHLDQKGLDQLAYLTNYNIVRLYSLSDKESGISPATMSDRFVLAATDRNIRMIFLNSKITRDPNKAVLVDTLDNIEKGLSGPGGAVARVKQAGFDIAPAEPFHYERQSWQRPLKLILVAGAASLGALLVGAFVPQLTMAVFAGLALASLALLVKSETTLSQLLALLAAVSAPTLAMIGVVKRVQARREQAASLPKISIAMLATRWFLGAFAVSAIGIFYVVGLLNHITYMLVLDQFRGVTMLHVVPIALTLLYIVFFSSLFEGLVERREGQAPSPLRDAGAIAKRILFMNITVIWIVAAAVLAAVMFYYVSRTGNEAQVSPYERIFRTLLEDKLGVRPRTKEFMLAHPLFILAAYIGVRYRYGLLLFVAGVIGQLSIVDTFAHLHTPLAISLIRILLGAGLGVIIGWVFIVIWEIVSRSWSRWGAKAGKL